MKDIPGSASVNPVMITDLAFSIGIFEGRIPSLGSVRVEGSSSSMD